MLKKIFITSGVVIGAFLVTCYIIGVQEETRDAQQSITTQASTRVEENEEVQERIQLTPEQEEILLRISVSEDRVKSGKLAEWQLEFLKQYNYIMDDYLKKKYPSYEFKIITAKPTNIYCPNIAEFEFIEKGTDPDISGWFKLDLVIDENDGSYLVTDSFYSQRILAEKLEAKLKTLLSQSGIECIRIKTHTFDMGGLEYDENYSLDDYVDTQQRTDIYIAPRKDGNYDKVYDKMKQVISNAGLQGRFKLWVKEVEDIDNNRADYIYKKSYDTRDED